MWRFAHVTDPHLASDRDGQWNNGFLCTLMPDVMECLRRDLAKLAPDFILATGDIASQQTREAMLASREMMDSLGFPYYPMGGNHDFVLEESRKWFLEAFGDRLPVPSTYYSFSHKNLHFCVLDAWWKWSDGTLSLVVEPDVADANDTSLKGASWVIPPQQLEWLEADLDAHQDRACVIAVHFPALPIPDRLRRPGIKDGGCLDNGDMLMTIASKFPQVRAIFAGHVHMHFIERVNGLTHVTTGAMVEYPMEYREVCVYDDRLEVYTHPLSDPRCAAKSLLPGKDWVSGEPMDRQTTIPLN